MFDEVNENLLQQINPDYRANAGRTRDTPSSVGPELGF